jgi:hypothetical protein
MSASTLRAVGAPASSASVETVEFDREAHRFHGLTAELLDAAIRASTRWKTDEGDWWVSFELRDGSVTRATYGRL